MARNAICENCGKAIEGHGWKAIPARVENGELVGTLQIDDAALQHEAIGDPIDLCRACVPVKHPRGAE